MRKVIFIFVMVLLGIFSASAEDILELDFLIQENNSVSLYNLRTVEGALPPEEAISSPYSIQIEGIDQKIAHQLSFPVYFFLPDPMEEVSETLVSLRVPYSVDYARLKLYHNKELLYERDLRSLCNHDFLCQDEENSISCPGDCPAGSADGWCDREVQEPCDPDCTSCSFSEMAAPEEQPFPLLPLVIGIVALVLVILLLAFLFERKKRRDRRNIYQKFK